MLCSVLLVSSKTLTSSGLQGFTNPFIGVSKSGVTFSDSAERGEMFAVGVQKFLRSPWKIYVGGKEKRVELLSGGRECRFRVGLLGPNDPKRKKGATWR